MLLLLLLLCVAFIVVTTTRLQLHPFLALIGASLLFGLLSGMPPDQVVAAINQGFGDTLGKIGLIIIAGTIIGVFLERSGGAFRLAEKILNGIGHRHVATAMALIGYVVAIPVFSDSGFVILAPLNKALSARAKVSLAGTAVALGLGLSTAHALIPPTPGPIAAAGILEADLGLVILLSLPVSLVALCCGWLFATRVAARTYIDPNPDMTEAEIGERLQHAPSSLKSLLPILVPLVLIVGRSVAALPSQPLGASSFVDVLLFVGDPVVALLIGMALAFLLPRRLEKAMLSPQGWVGRGLLDAALILLITGAGGAFGRVLQNSGIADVIGGALSGMSLGIWLPFILAAGIKSAQGSSTVSIITTASIVAPLLATLGYDSDVARALVVLAIGAGALVVSHANDSFFWIFTQMSNMTVRHGFRFQTVGTLILGVSAALIVWVLAAVMV
ncbi:gluconate:H+ symporter, GntP family [Catalinimonas alkaloidigena]|uniref:Gluconate:H+ symporter, GntP family n=1 Tax=Catalinimonas alkaloidigena TaxID=1075417 RepID=A0A1G9R9K0_9BACT|nr:gluconate:H+ symporter [Catalinimonas alkaloidigena]SDM19075.1 gluconate:H+ symporter, GntP family [Catalinimonas alkaloidigena]